MDPHSFISDLRNWYISNQRKLPWRENPSLYKTVVSEFMLQQTQVSTALPYYSRWLEAFPNFQILAQATEAIVLKHWEGLGYYSRARNLHKLAKQITALDSIPTDPKSWESFIGIGPYTAAAITSIAFNHPIAVVDGNVIRVMSRLTANDTLFKSNLEASKKINPVAHYFLDIKNPGDHNQAIMELGATICVKQKPLCLFCPVSSHCKAFTHDNPENFPKLERKSIENITINRVLAVNSNQILMKYRPPTERRLPNFYEFPLLEDFHNDTPPKDLLILSKKRGISNQRITENFYQSNLDIKTKLKENYHWITIEKLSDIQLSGPHRRWLKDLLKNQINS